MRSCWLRGPGPLGRSRGSSHRLCHRLCPIHQLPARVGSSFHGAPFPAELTTALPATGLAVDFAGRRGRPRERPAVSGTGPAISRAQSPLAEPGLLPLPVVAIFPRVLEIPRCGYSVRPGVAAETSGGSHTERPCLVLGRSGAAGPTRGARQVHGQATCDGADTVSIHSLVMSVRTLS